MIRAIALSLALLIGVGAIIPLTTDYAEAAKKHRKYAKKKKKVKKLLIDLKIPQHEKEQVWVVESNKKIVWVCGIRSDERFKVGPATKDILHLHFQKNNT